MSPYGSPNEPSGLRRGEQSSAAPQAGGRSRGFVSAIGLVAAAVVLIVIAVLCSWTRVEAGTPRMVGGGDHGKIRPSRPSILYQAHRPTGSQLSASRTCVSSHWGLTRRRRPGSNCSLRTSFSISPSPFSAQCARRRKRHRYPTQCCLLLSIRTRIRCNMISPKTESSGTALRDTVDGY